MRKLKPWIVTLIVSTCAAVTAQAQEKPSADPKPAAAADAADALTSPELAARYAALAQDTLRQKVVVPPHFRQAAGLLMAAMKLAPDEPRYPKMLFEAMLQLRDNDGALKALKAYRSVVLPPPRSPQDPEQPINDQLAMVNYLDLTALQLETADARLEYYKKFIDSAAPDPVRSHVAFRASEIAHERGQADLEDAFLGQALKLNPLNLEALRTRLEALTADGTTAERVATLVAMLKSNPVQPDVTFRIARELAQVALTEESIRYYGLTSTLRNATGLPNDRSFALGYATEIYMMGKPELLTAPKPLIDALLKQDPGDVDALLVRWLMERGGNEADVAAAAKTRQQVVNAALNHLITLRQQLGVTSATTRPVETPEAPVLPDLADDVAKLKDDKFEAVRLPYAQAVSDLAWYLVLVANQPAEAAKLLPTLKAILTDKDRTVVRIEGWIAMAQNQLDQAGIKLKAVADQDVMAQAGTYLLWAKNPAEKAHATAAAEKLLQQNPSGILGALLLDTLKELNVALVPSADANAVKDEIAKFPKDWLRVIDAPQNFYLLKGEMEGGRIIYPFGDPMMARVTIKNIGPFDLTVGANGVIKNDLWFDAQLRGLVQQLITGAAYERLGQVLLLKPGQSVTQTVRLDQGQLSQLLIGNPHPSLTFYGQVRTNPRGEGGSGLCGQGVAFANITERSGFSMNNNAIRTLTTLAASGTPAERLRSLELMAAEIEQMRDQLKTQPGNAQAQLLVDNFSDTLQRNASDTVAPVATWAAFLSAAHNPDKRPAMIEKLIVDPDPTRRVLGLLIANALPAEEQKKRIAKVIESDKDEIIQTYATGMMEILQVARPTTGPTPTTPTPSPLTPKP